MTEDPAVLIVEADIVVRHLLAEYLRDCGYRVVEASTTAEARDLLIDGLMRIGVVLADIDAADNSGFALAGWIRKNHPGTQILLAGTIALAVEKAGDLCEEGPAVGKPYEPRLVHEEIKRLLAARARRDR